MASVLTLIRRLGKVSRNYTRKAVSGVRTIGKDTRKIGRRMTGRRRKTQRRSHRRH